MPIFTEPVLSACIVLYESGMRVLHTVQCFQESDIDLELHVVDNAPTGTLSEHLQWQCPGILYYPQRRNLGYAGGNNAAIPNLRSQYHLICHPDVSFDEQLLSDMVAYMEQDKNCIILIPKILNADGTEQALPKQAPTLRFLLGSALRRLPGPFKAWHEKYTRSDSAITSPIHVESAPGCFLLIRTAALRHLNGLDPRFFYQHGDSDLSRRALELGSIVYHPEMTVTHDRQIRSRNLPEIFKRLGDSIRYLNKWGWGQSAPARSQK